MIKGIDSLTVLHKSVDYAKQVSDKMHNAEQGKDFMAQIEKEHARHVETGVNKTEHAEHERVNKEKERKQEKDAFYEERSMTDREDETQQASEELSEGEKGLGAEIDINI